MSDEIVVLHLDPGACRFHTKITGHKEDDKVIIHMESDCPYVKKCDEPMREINLEEIVHMPIGENRAYVTMGRLLRHSVCPVPMAYLKVAEVAMGLGLKKDIKAEYQK
ncbi:MAG: hypothetical protein A4E32_01327 [Methanomassiliicoccales archaeon PtaU1.Bin124]|nr:MAG: hypothetical protein A4E32_01327 [Methanomassiliicoccales archaeon PtaU1.Bin124]